MLKSNLDISIQGEYIHSTLNSNSTTRFRPLEKCSNMCTRIFTTTLLLMPRNEIAVESRIEKLQNDSCNEILFSLKTNDRVLDQQGSSQNHDISGKKQVTKEYMILFILNLKSETKVQIYV